MSVQPYDMPLVSLVEHIEDTDALKGFGYPRRSAGESRFFATRNGRARVDPFTRTSLRKERRQDGELAWMIVGQLAKCDIHCCLSHPARHASPNLDD